jgi:hypothetical protein
MIVKRGVFWGKQELKLLEKSKTVEGNNTKIPVNTVT